MSFYFFLILTIGNFALGGIWLFSKRIDSVEEIITGAVILWALTVSLIAVRSLWRRFDVLDGSFNKTPHSENFRITAMTGLSNLVMSIALLAESESLTGDSAATLLNFVWLLLLVFSAHQLATSLPRAVFQWKAKNRLTRRRRFEVNALDYKKR